MGKVSSRLPLRLQVHLVRPVPVLCDGVTTRPGSLGMLRVGSD